MIKLVIGRLISELERSPNGEQYMWTLTKQVPTPLFSLFPVRKILLSEVSFSLFLSLLSVPFGLSVEERV